MWDIKELSEEDIRFRYIDPAIKDKWETDNIRTEFPITDGEIVANKKDYKRKQPKAADYALFVARDFPIAIVEAKNNKKSASYGLQQAITYGQMLQVPFVYSSNGDKFVEHDFLTGEERKIPLDEFPTKEELLVRYKCDSNNGKGLTENEIKIYNVPYYTSQNSYSPRYYQVNAINKTVNAVINGQDRILLAMATGTGKTYVAFQIIYRLLKGGFKKKILYLADRNNLVDQSIKQDFRPLEKTIHKINYRKDDPTTITSYEVYFSLYQQLADKESDDIDDEYGEETLKRLSSLFNKDFFDLIIVDECHRGSAKKDSNWRKILEYFDSATQIGMTATPKETKYVSNIDYFGEPIYSYSLKEGIKDGFLAPFKVINLYTTVYDCWRPLKGQTDKYGHEIEDKIYTNEDFDKIITLEDYNRIVAQEITNYLKATDRMQKTIVFCQTEEHAERMRFLLSNLNADKVKENPDYVVRITGSDAYGKSKLDYFISTSAQYPVIATTSKLLSTGADAKMTKLIVLDQTINSMTEFKQIIGRGTRIREKEGKVAFTIMDFRGATRLFSDPDWDGDLVQDVDYKVVPFDNDNDGKDDNLVDDGEEKPDPRYKPVVDKYGCPVEITGKVVRVYDSKGKLLRQESIIDYTKTNIMDEYATLDNFIQNWTDEEKKSAIKDALLEHGIDLDSLKAEENMEDVDDFDFICHVAFDVKPLTRAERANNVQKRDFLNKYSGVAKQVLEDLIDKYKNLGIYEIEDLNVLKLDPFRKYGRPNKIINEFGGKDNYQKAVKELVSELYKAA